MAKRETGSVPLKDHKHELFCRHYANTHHIINSYELAGYTRDGPNAHRLFKKKPIQDRIAYYIDQQLQKLDISVEKTLKHLAAIAYSNPMEMLHFDETTVAGEPVVLSSRTKAPSEIPPWLGCALTKVKENQAPDGGIVMEYGFEGKVPALRTLLSYLEESKGGNDSVQIVVKHKMIGQNSDGPKVTVKL